MFTRSYLRWPLRAAAICALAAAAGGAQADDFCCQCKGQATGKTIDASDDMSATFECSMTCRRPTVPRPGKCEVAAPAPTPAPAPAPTAAPTAPEPSGRVRLYKSEDCSGDPVVVTQSVGQLAAQQMGGMRSFSVESGAPASAFEQANFAGQRAGPVAPSVCVSPGWEIAGVRFGGR